MNSVSQMVELAVQYHRAGNLHQAELLYRQILQSDPVNANALHLLGLLASQLGRNDLAVAYLQQALRHRPDFVVAYNNLGNVLRNQGQLAEAIANYRQALRLKPDYAEAHNNLGIVLQEQGQLDEAIANYQRALRLKPDYAEAYNNLGIVLHEKKQLDEAISNYRQALRLQPDFAEAYNNLGIVLQEQKQLDEANTSYQQALRLKPNFVEAYNNLGNVLKEQGQLDEAIANYRQALRLQPDYAEAYNNLGIILRNQGKLDEAIANYQQVLRLKPNDVEAHSNLVFILHYHPDYDANALSREARRWNERHAEPLAKFRPSHANTVDAERRLRIGYVSPDFRDHPVANLMLPLLANHDRRQVEIYCYAEVASPDEITHRLRACADEWRATVGLSDEQVADMVRKDRIDILVDLALHTANNRLLVFARKPAPVQVTWMVPGTSGLSSMDYRLTDAYLDPPSATDSYYAEQSLRLPDMYWCYDPLSAQPLVNELPALANGFITFGSLNNFCKVNDGVLVLWAQVLRAVPQSRLLLLAPGGYARDPVLAILKQQRIDEARVEFTDRQPRPQYLQLYHRIDLGLDLLPYNGHTTSLDAFWMGVPIITLIGKTVVGRVGWSQLCNLGLAELAAQTPAEYVAIAAQLAGDLPRLQELRATLRARLSASPLMDGKRFAGHMEQAFRQMWRTWCQERETSK